MSKWATVIPRGCSGTWRRIGIRMRIGIFDEVVVVETNTIRCYEGERIIQDLAELLFNPLDVTGVIAHIDTDSKRRALLPMQRLPLDEA